MMSYDSRYTRCGDREAIVLFIISNNKYRGMFDLIVRCIIYLFVRIMGSILNA